MTANMLEVASWILPEVLPVEREGIRLFAQQN